jgi:SAM-dependent methyltransferase
MDDYQDKTYGELIAGVYDEWYAGYDETTIDVLKELAHGGRALELGIGTGRVALPLQQAGVEVHGIDASEAMVAQLKAKPGGESIPVTLGNLGDVAVEGQYDLIYVLFNTLYALLTQEDQVQCFNNVAQRLVPQGRFAIECFVPDLSRFDRGQTVRAVALEEDEVRLDVTKHDAVAQQITSQHVLLTEGGIRLFPVKLRYAWPTELDLMARLAGLKLENRWGDWRKGAFTDDSGTHISVYQRAE